MAEIPKTLFDDYRQARQYAKLAANLAADLADEIRALAGQDEVLTVDGTKVGTYERIKKFASKAFIKARPELAEQFTRHRYVEEIDEAKLLRMLPEVYGEFQVRALNIDDE